MRSGELVEHVDEQSARGAEQAWRLEQGVWGFAVHLEGEQRGLASRLREEARGGEQPGDRRTSPVCMRKEAERGGTDGQHGFCTVLGGATDLLVEQVGTRPLGHAA